MRGLGCARFGVVFCFPDGFICLEDKRCLPFACKVDRFERENPYVILLAPVRMRTSLVAASQRFVLGHAFSRYLIAGGFNTGLTFLCYVTGVEIGLPYIVANILAWCVGLIVSFCLNSSVVFRRGISVRRFPRFLAANLFSLMTSTCALILLVRYCALGAIMASVITIPIVVVLNFLAARFFVFGNKL